MPPANKPLNHETVQSGPSRRKLVPRTVREATLLRLEPEQQRYIDAGAALSFEFAFKQEYLYIAARQPRGVWGGGFVAAPLCRLRYVGDLEMWGFEIYLYSDDEYDAEQDFPHTGGSPEDCFAVAVDFYLLQYDVLEAGSRLMSSLRREIGEPLEVLDGPQASARTSRVLLPSGLSRLCRSVAATPDAVEHQPAPPGARDEYRVSSCSPVPCPSQPWS